MNIPLRPLFLIIALLALLTIAGCQSVPVENVVYKTKYVLVSPEASYLKATKINPPPVVSVYAEGEDVDWEAEYKKSTVSLIETYRDLGQCNADKNAARVDIEEKRKRYE